MRRLIALVAIVALVGCTNPSAPGVGNGTVTPAPSTPGRGDY